MTTTTEKRRELTPGQHERHVAHMREIRRRRLGARYRGTEDTEGEIELSDSKLEERVERLEDQMSSVEIAMGQHNQKLDALIESLQGVSAEFRRLQGARIAIDETSMEQITTHMEACFLRASERSAERHAEALRNHVLQGVDGTMKKLIPKGSNMQKVAAVAGIITCVVALGMAGAYAYAVYNYEPPEVRLTADGTAHGEGGSPLA